MKKISLAKIRATALSVAILCAVLVLTALLVPAGDAMWYGQLTIEGEITLQNLTPTPSPTVSNSQEVIPEGGAPQGKKVRLEPIVDSPVPTEVPGKLPAKPLGAATPASGQPGTSEPAQTPVPTSPPAPTSLPPKSAN